MGIIMQSSEKLHTTYTKPEIVEVNSPESLVIRRRTDVHLADIALSATTRRTRLDVLEDERAVIIDSRPETD